jgi:hypothetical protein
VVIGMMVASSQQSRMLERVQFQVFVFSAKEKPFLENYKAWIIFLT